MRRPLCLTLALAAVVACRSSDAPQDALVEAPPPPLDAEQSHADVWGYLLARYDADGDGRVSRAEYGRDARAFERLDVDRDGALSAADFEIERDPIDTMLSQLLLGQYLQDDDDPLRLESDELDAAFGAYDVDFDARLTAQEFEAAHEERARFGRPIEREVIPGMDQLDAYAVLLRALDAGADGALDYDEVAAFHARFLADGELARVYETVEAAHTAIATPGELAPDFTLATVGGEGEVTLSELRGERPVALIFGSYT